MVSYFHQIFDFAPWFAPFMAALVGAVIGSLLNVVIVRIPANESIVAPGSHCACGKAISWRDNVPILSWVLLRGRARCCGQPVSVRYPLVELAGIVIFLSCWLLLPPAHAVCGWVFGSCLLAGSAIDLEHQVIPDRFTMGLAAVGFALSLAVPSLHIRPSGPFVVDLYDSGRAAIVGLLVGSAVILWMAMFLSTILKKDVMGLGDVKLVGAIGAFCGWRGALFSFYFGALLMVVIFSVSLLARGLQRRDQAEPPGAGPGLSLGVPYPFGPAISLSGFLYFLCLHGRVDAWLMRMGI